MFGGKAAADAGIAGRSFKRVFHRIGERKGVIRCTVKASDIAERRDTAGMASQQVDSRMCACPVLSIQELFVVSSRFVFRFFR